MRITSFTEGIRLERLIRGVGYNSYVKSVPKKGAVKT
jgi:hypothetical protein